MNSKNHTLSSRKETSRRSGWTLVEMLIAVTAGSIVLLAVAQLTLFTAKSFVALGNYDALDQSSQNALDILSKDIRQTQALTSFSTNQLVFKDWDGSVISFTWDPNARTFTRTKGGQSKVLLQQCDFLSFSMYQRVCSNNFVWNTTTDPKLAKLIALNWKCSRQIFQRKVNTESVQTATIVRRN
jgi:prepilin-type N-terminal cleavage/methylation domain-containing protein